MSEVYKAVKPMPLHNQVAAQQTINARCKVLDILADTGEPSQYVV